MSKRKTGTKEWSVASVNFHNGCKNRCRYCYAKADALRYKRIDHHDEWGTTYCTTREKDVRKKQKKYDGVVMVPSTHDLWPENLDDAMTVIGNLLEVGNRVLVVSKPLPECIDVLCDEFDGSGLEFRFSIGARSDEVLRYWEPGAPSFKERVYCLARAWRCGFETSVSCEPLLDADDLDGLFATVAPFITDSFWIGMMNRMKSRVPPPETEEDVFYWDMIEEGQTRENILSIYSQFHDSKLIRWKDSCKKVLGLE